MARGGACEIVSPSRCLSCPIPRLIRTWQPPHSRNPLSNEAGLAMAASDWQNMERKMLERDKEGASFALALLHFHRAVYTLYWTACLSLPHARFLLCLFNAQRAISGARCPAEGPESHRRCRAQSQQNSFGLCTLTCVALFLLLPLIRLLTLIGISMCDISTDVEADQVHKIIHMSTASLQRSLRPSNEHLRFNSTLSQLPRLSGIQVSQVSSIKK